ncbi:Uncharacterized protein BM_BM10260 [Brugia malayi]|uniref:Bm10260 n=1 Tax=Brugia malayi TaxID=6279 RepID=A0A0K0IMM6_BRUMA|nr:Uncharacterized protein BM_BM10260 [Brugia malayi]CDP97371.1 Bm10260 [Brugia malayi]VIO92824.1 Uncharacterized protein BM_BM10260 [Brugia malayi]
MSAAYRPRSPVSAKAQPWRPQDRPGISSPPGASRQHDAVGLQRKNYACSRNSDQF